MSDAEHAGLEPGGARVAVRLLGSAEVTVDGRRVDERMGRRGVELLAYLAIRPSEAHSREVLMTALWPDKDTLRASASLRRALFLVRRELGGAADDVLVVNDAAIGLRSGRVATDLAAVEAALAERSLAGQRRALELAAERGRLLEPWSPDWVLIAQEELTRRVLDAGRAALRAMEAAGATPDEREKVAGAVLALDPLDEVAHAAILRSRIAAGDRSGALAGYRLCRDRLARELGVSPSAEIEGLYALGLAMAERPAPDATNSQPRRLPAAAVATAPLSAAEGNATGSPTLPGMVPDDAATSTRAGRASPPTERPAADRRPVANRLRWGAAVAAAIVLVVGAVVASQRVAAAGRTADELVNEHLLATHMESLEVQSADPDVIDAWFANRLSYPVASAPGTLRYQLLGAGLCDVSGRIAATAVYRGPLDRRVSVFTFPANGLVLPYAPTVAPGVHGAEHEGYGIVFWTAGGLVHAVVAELPLEELIPLAPALAGT